MKPVHISEIIKKIIQDLIEKANHEKTQIIKLVEKES